MADKIVDACSLINLFASGKAGGIIAACGGDFYVSEQVRGESLTIREPDKNDASILVPAPIDLAGAIAGGILKECRLEGEAENEAYIEFAAQVDDGEASCLAIAKSRGWLVATDDRKAIRLATESGIKVITTPELIERWANATSPANEDLAEVIRSIERFARFRPRSASPLYAWWTAISEAP